MPYPAPFMRLVVQGIGYAGEGWSYGLNFAAPGSTSGGTVPDEVPTGIVNAVSAFHSGSYISAGCDVTEIKWNLLGTDGKYASQTGSVGIDLTTSPISGSGSGVNHPAQVSLAITLDTVYKRGAGHIGRFYMPYPNGGIVADTGCFTTAMRDSVMAAAKTYIQALNAASGGRRLCIASKVGPGGALQPVTSIRVGTRPDIIRSRANGLSENYSSVAINQPA